MHDPVIFACNSATEKSGLKLMISSQNGGQNESTTLTLDKVQNKQ